MKTRCIVLLLQTFGQVSGRGHSITRYLICTFRSSKCWRVGYVYIPRDEEFS